MNRTLIGLIGLIYTDFFRFLRNTLGVLLDNRSVKKTPIAERSESPGVLDEFQGGDRFMPSRCEKCGTEFSGTHHRPER
jgi:hypothetical protein